MTRKPLRTIRFAAALFGLAFIEWVLFELIRAPYRPPEDMTTFLGTEKYAIVGFILFLAVVGLDLISRWAARSMWTKKDVTTVAALIMAIAGAGLYVITRPSWPVTPLNWVLK